MLTLYHVKVGIIICRPAKKCKLFYSVFHIFVVLHENGGEKCRVFDMAEGEPPKRRKILQDSLHFQRIIQAQKQPLARPNFERTVKNFVFIEKAPHVC
ncbi:MAG: hypothetical protein IJU96_04480 [Clostridia bacterium]|nr:hypothetical protein [Clostridia bacterium]